MKDTTTLRIAQIKELRKHVLEDVPRYSYLNAEGNKSQYRYWKFRLADWIMEGKLMGTVIWFRKLCDLLKDLETTNNV